MSVSLSHNGPVDHKCPSRSNIGFEEWRILLAEQQGFDLPAIDTRSGATSWDDIDTPLLPLLKPPVAVRGFVLSPDQCKVIAPILLDALDHFTHPDHGPFHSNYTVDVACCMQICADRGTELEIS